jgi:hypothetical protein
MDSVIRIPDWAFALRDAIEAYNEQVIPSLDIGDYVSGELHLSLFVVPYAVSGYRRSLSFDAGTISMYSLGLAGHLKALQDYLGSSRISENYDPKEIVFMMKKVDEKLVIVEKGVSSVIRAFEEKCRETEGMQ